MGKTASNFDRLVKQTRIKNILAKTFIYLFLSAWAMTTIYALFWVVNNSFKDKTVILSDSFSLAVNPIPDNYITAFNKMNIGRAYLNSFIISGCTVIFVMILAGLAAYAMTRYNFRLKNTLYMVFAGSILFPAFSTIVPIFKMVLDMKLVSNPLGVIIPQTASYLSFAIIVLMGFMSNLPLELEEAAFMEGCNVFNIFARIILPLSKPAFATVAIFTFCWSYNDLFVQMVILRKRDTYPICTLLNEISSQFGTDFGLMASAVTIVVFPVLIVYLFLQNNIVKGLTAGAIKG
ncbi:MAG: carbohydrate ABC transporter permease [Clostridiaceae bacterium]|nr:carbohydrate ABC transporter permease [Clostridiaceae bacterium]